MCVFVCVCLFGSVFMYATRPCYKASFFPNTVEVKKLINFGRNILLKNKSIKIFSFNHTSSTESKCLLFSDLKKLFVLMEL